MREPREQPVEPSGNPNLLSPFRAWVWLIRAAFLTCIFLVVALIGEVAFRVVLPQNLSGFWYVTSERGYSYNKSGGMARHQLGERVVYYHFNEHHLRGPAVDFTHARTLVLGDSFTFGWLLNEDKTYVALLARACAREFGLANCQLLNGGVGGWGTADYLAFLEDFGSRISPTRVIVFLNFDDARRSLNSALYRLKSRGRLELEPLRKRVRYAGLKQTVNGIPGYQWLLERSHLVQASRRVLIELVTRRASRSSSFRTASVQTGNDADGTAEAVALQKALFRRIRQWCLEHKAELLVVTTGFQSLAFLEAGAEGSPINATFFREAQVFFSNEGVPFADISGAMLSDAQGNLRGFTIPGDEHPSEAGAELIARHAWAWLRPRFESSTAVVRDRSAGNAQFIAELFWKSRGSLSVPGYPPVDREGDGSDSRRQALPGGPWRHAGNLPTRMKYRGHEFSSSSRVIGRSESSGDKRRSLACRERSSCGSGLSTRSRVSSPVGAMRCGGSAGLRSRGLTSDGRTKRVSGDRSSRFLENRSMLAVVETRPIQYHRPASRSGSRSGKVIAG